MSTITTKDGTEIYYKEWGEGPVVTFSHGWPLRSDAWDGQMQFCAQNGYRGCVLITIDEQRFCGSRVSAVEDRDRDGHARRLDESEKRTWFLAEIARDA